MFYEDNHPKQEAAFQELIDFVIKETQVLLDVPYIKFNRRNFMRRDQKNPKRLLDYALFVFETEEIAKTFIEILEQ